MDLTKVINFDSVRVYRWLLSVADPDRELYAYLRAKGVDLNHTFNLLGGAVARVPCSFTGLGRPTEDCMLLPILDVDDETPIDVLAFSMREPAKFGTMLGLGGVLGANSVDNPASYAGGQPCRLLRTPLKWLHDGCVGCAVVLDPEIARPALSAAAGDLAAEDEDHARDLVSSGAVHVDRLLVPLLRAAA
jgi:hypothetical protein